MAHRLADIGSKIHNLGFFYVNRSMHSRTNVVFPLKKLTSGTIRGWLPSFRGRFSSNRTRNRLLFSSRLPFSQKEKFPAQDSNYHRRTPVLTIRMRISLILARDAKVSAAPRFRHLELKSVFMFWLKLRRWSIVVVVVSSVLILAVKICEGSPGSVSRIQNGLQ